MRRIATTLVIAALTLAVATPANAGKPVRGCPNDGFVLMSYSAFRALSIELGVPEDLLGPDHLAAWNGFDRNDDGLACIKDLPDTAGHLGSWVFNAIDNTSNR